MISVIKTLGLMLLSLLLLGACESEQQAAMELATGRWRFVLELGEGRALPFTAQVEKAGKGYRLVIRNAAERLAADTLLIWGDSLRIQLAVFDSELVGELQSATTLRGEFRDHARPGDYRLPFRAERSDAPRFAGIPAQADLAPRYAVTFSPATDEAYPAVGTFVQQGESVTGTFLTETGDYRYLAGRLSGDTLKLSAFDGSHAFLLVGQVQGDSIQGDFFSGNHWQEPWIAGADAQAQLRDPDSLTYLKDGYQTLAFSFPNAQGEKVSLDDPRYQGKVVIVQLLGSWCPNCMDETRLLADWYQRYRAQGLEIIGLAFERAADSATAWRNLQRMQRALDVEYELLLAANSPRKVDAAAALPMLNHVMSFPTSIYLDRQGRVRRIHTGFYGPGTGAPYLRFVEQYEAFLVEMLSQE
jgi:thiol-disulfide isomerase/thioredoxin